MKGASAMASEPRNISPLPWPTASGLPRRARDQQILLAGEEHGEREGALQPLQRLGHRLDRLQAAVERHGDEMRDDLGVGLAGEVAAGGADLRASAPGNSR